MNLAFVIGNGKSRQTVELSGLKQHGTVYVCNQAVFDISADHAVAVDRHMVMQIASQGYPEETKLWTRARWQRQLSHERAIHALPNILYQPTVRWDRELHWSSGTHAAWMAATAHDVVVLIGFDLWDGSIYNSTHLVDPRHWIHQLKATFCKHSTVQFVQVQPTGWEFPNSWRDCENLSTDTISNVLALIGR